MECPDRNGCMHERGESSAPFVDTISQLGMHTVSAKVSVKKGKIDIATWNWLEEELVKTNKRNTKDTRSTPGPN